MNTRHAVSAGLLAAAALFAGASTAQVPGGPHGPEVMGHERMGPESIGPMRGFERLHKELNLNATQEELWKKAQAAQQEAFKTMRAKGEETRARLRAEIDKPGVDLKQYAQMSDKLRDETRAQMEATRKQVRTAWFGVYDSLDAKQREQVRVAIRDGMDRMAHRGGRRGGMHGQRFGQGQGEHRHGNG
ncbi:MAG TPA: periplasmic heavy metal sensor [Burkholderiales bacterium]|nr:periplasmic heavy metal sensor [Burkholderiales bacterium]